MSIKIHKDEYVLLRLNGAYRGQPGDLVLGKAEVGYDEDQDVDRRREIELYDIKGLPVSTATFRLEEWRVADDQSVGVEDLAVELIEIMFAMLEGREY